MISARSLFRPLLPLRRPGRDWTAATDAELALAARDRARAGKDAFVEIVRRHQAAVSAVAYSVTGRIGLTDDIAQETFLKAWKRVSTLREPGKLKAWLTKMLMIAPSMPCGGKGLMRRSTMRLRPRTKHRGRRRIKRQPTPRRST